MGIDTNTPIGARAMARARDEHLAWLVTVSPAGQPQPSRIWLEWDDDGTILIFSQPDTPKLRNIAANPRVSVHFDGDDRGGNVCVIFGTAAVTNEPGADQRASYVAKYRDYMARNGWSPADFAALYSVPVRITPTRVRGW